MDGKHVIGRSHSGAVKGHAQVRRLVHRRWTDKRRQLFLEELARTSNVAASARAAGISPVQVYRHRRRDPGFRAAWSEALREGYQALEMLLLERARKGTPQPVFHGGKRVGTVRAFNDSVALRLLALHRESVSTAGGSDDAPAPEPTIEEIKAELAEMRARRAALEADGE